MAHITRREFVGGAVAFSGLALSLELPAQETARQAAPGAARPPRTPSAFLQIGEDDGITIITPGGGDGAGRAYRPADDHHGGVGREVGSDCGVADAPAAAIYNNPLFGLQATVGSFSVRGWYTELRRIGAAARIMLLQAAAHTWKVSANECSGGWQRVASRAQRAQMLVRQRGPARGQHAGPAGSAAEDGRAVHRDR